IHKPIEVSAGNIHTPSAASQPKSSPTAIGKLIPEARAAKRLIAVVYTLVIKGTRSGKRSLIIPGSKTFAIAIPIPLKLVLIDNYGINGIDLTINPLTSGTILLINVVWFVFFILILGTKRDIIPKVIKGRLVKIPMLKFDNERLSRKRSLVGPTEVTAGRKL